MPAYGSTQCRALIWPSSSNAIHRAAAGRSFVGGRRSGALGRAWMVSRSCTTSLLSGRPEALSVDGTWPLIWWAILG
jgi:hypothetical protein